MSTNFSPLQVSNAQLLKSTVAAALTAAVIVVVAVLPAEFGRDPTGLGGVLGLTALSQAAATASVNPAVAPAAALGAVTPQPASVQTGEFSISLESGQGVEVKALMRAGEAFVFDWSANGPVDFDMHGEKPNDGNNFTSYWAERQQTGAHGSFVAPFDGTHGWYWENSGAGAVTISVKVSGFYHSLYRSG